MKSGQALGNRGHGRRARCCLYKSEYSDAHGTVRTRFVSDKHKQDAGINRLAGSSTYHKKISNFFSGKVGNRFESLWRFVLVLDDYYCWLLGRKLVTSRESL